MNKKTTKKVKETQVIKKEDKAADRVLERISEINEEALYPTDLKEAVIGMVERFGMEPLVLIDKSKCIDIYIHRDGMSYEDAHEFFEFNVIGAWMGKGTPCFATLASSEFFL